jgi:hypothetical protein
MAVCANCFGLFPPDFLEEAKDDDKLCVFCKIGKDHITLDKKTGRKNYTRRECMEDYRKFLNLLHDNPRISRKLVEGVKEEKGE